MTVRFVWPVIVMSTVCSRCLAWRDWMSRGYEDGSPQQDDIVTMPIRILPRKKIFQLWMTKVKKGQDYFNKIRDPVAAFERLGVDIPILLQNKSDEFFRKHMIQKDFARIPIWLDFLEWVRLYGLTTPESLLVTFPKDYELGYLKPKNVTVYMYNPDTEEGDLHLLHEKTLPGEPFDFAHVSQTLEHLYSPQLCLYNIFQKLRPGGYFFTSTPALNVQHMTPVHFVHYTPMALAAFVTQVGFEVVEIGQFGSLDYEKLLLTTYEWPSFHRLPFPIQNDPKHPDQVWVLARKPL